MENKAEFVEKYLKPLLIAANVEVIDAVYEKQGYEEIVRITFWGERFGAVERTLKTFLAIA